ncbi:putative lipid II flippase FtsW [Microbacterium sediminis]|uniref:Probable peptidoglycan glycosyltransferase FtsW n=1 Tax=Microbacterium sediminis TaxID=904291 RepID=A0A1B9N981_9MICO|nr:putative lipid II flippase FtsW [Microbacterium sediminis]OCG73159.1 cell division protein FtsW [Microbacterium sediminis]
MSTTMRPPARTDGSAPQTPQRRGLLARVSLGDAFAAAPVEFLLIASTALILTGFGLVMVLSATSATSVSAGGSPYDAAIRHAIFAAVGIPLMFIVSRFPVRFLKKISWFALIAAVCLQLLVFVPGIGYEFQGNRNWILIAGYTLQPSEFLKLALALWLGFILYRKRTLLASWSHVFIPLVPVSAFAIGTVLAGKDLGTAMILVLIALGALFFSGVKLRIFLLPLIGAVVAVAALAITSPNRMARILSFLDSECADYYDTCYQPLHGIWALAEGGIFGLGLGNSKQKYEWLPEAQNDYIFAIVGEELGLIGCMVVLGLFALFAFGAFRIIRRTDDPFVRVVAGAITIWVVGQAIINIGVVLRVFPVLGVPLPFLSAGGTSLLSVLMATGVLLALARTLPPVSATMTPVAPAERARR